MRVDEPAYFADSLEMKELVPSAGCVLNEHVGAGAAIATTKMLHRHALAYHQVDGSDIVAAIAPVWICRGATATIISVEVACLDAPEGGDEKFTVDLKKSNVGTPTPATVLTGVIDYVVDTPDCTVLAGTIDSAALVDGDTLVVVVAVSGAAGNQGQGLAVTVLVDEAPA